MADRIELETLEETEIYIVDEVVIVDPDAVEVLDPTEASVDHAGNLLPVLLRRLRASAVHRSGHPVVVVGGKGQRIVSRNNQRGRVRLAAD